MTEEIFMRLRYIINEFSKSDFFDFYTLEAAYRNSPDPELLKRLRFEAQWLYTDLIDQLFVILVQRFQMGVPNSVAAEFPESNRGDNNKAILKKHGLKLPSISNSKRNYSPIPRAELLALSPDKRRALIYDLSQSPNKANTGVVWRKIAVEYLNLPVEPPTDTTALINIVDKLFGMCHHGGMLSDYTNESSWLEDALHIRYAGDPSQLAAYASNEVKELVRGLGASKNPVSDIQKLEVAAYKVLRNTQSDISIAGGNLVLDLFYIPHHSDKTWVRLGQVTMGQPKGYWPKKIPNEHKIVRAIYDPGTSTLTVHAGPNGTTVYNRNQLLTTHGGEPKAEHELEPLYKPTKMIRAILWRTDMTMQSETGHAPSSGATKIADHERIFQDIIRAFPGAIVKTVNAIARRVKKINKADELEQLQTNQVKQKLAEWGVMSQDDLHNLTMYGPKSERQ